VPISAINSLRRFIALTELEKTIAQLMAAEPFDLVTFFFDPVSPYSWLASKELWRIEGAGLAVSAQPVLFAGLLNAHGSKGPAEIPAKRLYTFRDVVRIAARRGLTFRGPPTHPFNPLRALRMCIALENREVRNRFACALLEAAWEEGLDLSDAKVVSRIADHCGLSGSELGDAVGSAEIKDRLTAATRHAVAAGVFGVPTFQWQGELFWGADRIDALLWRSQGNAVPQAGLQDFLQRGASAQRRPS
jgi:2-hydroxychromene-2-carboxylate isomerase